MERKFLKMDLHIHSSYSFDCHTPPKDIIREAKKKGMDIIGITDHGTREGGIEAERIAKGIRVLVGQEVKTKQGDVLVFGVDEDLEQGKDSVKTCKKARALGGFIIVPHPFDPLRQGTGKHTEKIVKYVDAIEGFNQKCFFNWSNKKAVEFAQKHGIPALAVSDSHKKGELGRVYTLIEGEDPFQSIREGRISMVTSPIRKGELIKKRLKKALRKGK